MNIATVVGWKFNHAPGICTCDGEVTAFPNPCTDRDGNARNSKALPTPDELAQWTQEYNAWLAAKPAPLTLEQRLAALEAQAVKADKTFKPGVVS